MGAKSGKWHESPLIFVPFAVSWDWILPDYRRGLRAWRVRLLRLEQDLAARRPAGEMGLRRAGFGEGESAVDAYLEFAGCQPAPT